MDIALYSKNSLQFRYTFLKNNKAQTFGEDMVVLCDT